NNAPPYRQIRALYDDLTVRVYQAYSDAIAEAALAKGTFVSPPFKMNRMTWIKPSFLWMMYRSGWGLKDAGQERVLAIDITREGFEGAPARGGWRHRAADGAAPGNHGAPVRIQWDPERDLLLRPLDWRAIQIGLSREAVELYVGNWIRRITDVSELAREIRPAVLGQNLERARAMLPAERTYPVAAAIEERLGMRQR